MKKYNLRGAAIGGSVDGLELSDPETASLLGQGRAARRAGLHPSAGDRRHARRSPAGSKGNGYLDNVVAFPLETTIALSHLVFEGTLDRFPGLKICAAHGGGYLPS